MKMTRLAQHDTLLCGVPLRVGNPSFKGDLHCHEPHRTSHARMMSRLEDGIFLNGGRQARVLPLQCRQHPRGATLSPPVPFAVPPPSLRSCEKVPSEGDKVPRHRRLGNRDRISKPLSMHSMVSRITSAQSGVDSSRRHSSASALSPFTNPTGNMDPPATMVGVICS